MKQIDAGTGVEVLDRSRCLELLAGEEVGRLAVVTPGGGAHVVPVNYVLDGEAIVFRSFDGAKYDHGRRAGVCFEIDAFDRPTRSGWSVVAHGRMEEVTDFSPRDHERLRHLPVDPWAKGDKPHLLRVVPDRITGRRVG